MVERLIEDDLWDRFRGMRGIRPSGDGSHRRRGDDVGLCE